MVVTSGGCLCGAVRYEIVGDLRGVVNCPNADAFTVILGLIRASRSKT